MLDPLRDISSAAEDKSDEMSPVMRRLRLVAELLGCTVAVVHHTGKLSADTAKRRPGQRLRGSSAIRGSIDSGIYLADTAGDGIAKFTNTVDSEVKGARSAGRFQLGLLIEDDATDEAVRATWKYSRDTAASADPDSARDAKDDRIVFERVRDLEIQGIRHTRRRLRGICGISEGRARDEIARLLKADRFELRDLPEGKDRVCVHAPRTDS